MIYCDKLRTDSFHNLSKIMISYDKRVAVFPNSIF